MALEPGTKLGGRGCPNCGGHNTEGLGKRSADGKPGVKWCVTCRHRWHPCKVECRGFRLNLKGKDGPMIIGCPECRVPDRFARSWPEAYRAMAGELQKLKSLQLAVSNPSD